LFFIRSSPRGSKLPARGHTFILFLDRNFVVRTCWNVDQTLGRLSVSGSKLLLDGNQLFDYSQSPPQGDVLVDGAIQQLPQWN
jgi:hypothetical protein